MAASDRDVRGFQAPTEFGPRSVDDRARQHRAGDVPQDGLLDEISRTASGAAADRRAAVVAALGAALEVRLPTHPRPARAMQQATQHVLAERSRLVADPGARRDRGHRPAVLRLAEDRLVPPGSFVTAALLDEAEVHPAAAGDVLDRLAGPDAAVRHALPVHEVGHLDQRPLGQLMPHPADDRSLLGHDDEFAGVDEAARAVVQAAVAERIMAAVPAILEELPLHPGHSFRVKIALELRGQAGLAVQVATRCPIEPGTRHVGHEERHLLAFQLVVQVEHQPGIAGETREVVDGDRRRFACGQGPQERLVAVARRAEARLVPARVGDHADRRAGRQERPTGGLLQLVADVGGARLLVRAADVDQVLGHPSMNARCGRDRKTRTPTWRRHPPLTNDCTNFASRSLHAGGYSYVVHTVFDSWYWYTAQDNTRSWSYTDELYGFLIYWDKDANGRGGGTVVATQIGATASQTYNSLAKGDLIFFDWENDGQIDHVRVEVGWGTPSRTGYQSAYNNSYWTTGDWADQHTQVRYHDMWNGYWQMTAAQRTGAKIYQVHIDPLNV